MIADWMRNNVVATALLTLLRVYLGWTWMTIGWHKIVGGFSSGGFLQGALARSTGDNATVPGWWGSFLETFAIPFSGLFDILIPWGEFLVGLGLLVGALTVPAAFFGVVMNFSFLFSGVISSNPSMIIMGFILMYAGHNAGKFGLDFWVNPWLSERLSWYRYH